jgi:hypothetical protein
MKIVTAILAALIVAALGCYVLLVLKSAWGAGLVLLALCIAFPTTIRVGVSEFAHSASDLKEAGVVVLPVVFDAKAGGERRTDPPAAPPIAPIAPLAPIAPIDPPKEPTP